VSAAAGRVSTALLVAFAAIALWNASTYPPGLGYDAADHIAYAQGILAGEGLPDGIGEYYTPPGFYTIAAGLTWAGEQVGLGDPRRLVLGLNALLALGTALLLLALARELFPGRRVVHLAALGFFACSALVLKSAAMYHPETLDLFLSTLALLLAARVLVRRDFRVVPAVAVGLALGAGQLVRAFSLWTFGVVLLAFAAAALAHRASGWRVAAAAAVTVVATLAVAGPWYAYQSSRYTNPIFDRPQQQVPLWERRPAAFYVDPGLPDLVTRPYRPHLVNRFAPTLYAEGWGDWFGVFAYKAHEGLPGPGTRRDLVAQSLAGLLPTLLMLAGWLALLAASLRRLDPPRLLVALLPLAGIAGMLYFTVSYPTPDGDVIKATYMLTTVPAWALCFGLAVERLARRGRAVAGALAVVLALAALAGLRFSVYGSPLGGLL
jgi:hypothetical protein